MIQSHLFHSPTVLLLSFSHQLLLCPPLTCQPTRECDTRAGGFIMNWQNQRLIIYRQGMETWEGYGSCKSQKKLVTKTSLLNSSFLGYHLPQDSCESLIFSLCEEERSKSLLQHHCFPFLSSHSHQQTRIMPTFSIRVSKMLQIIWTLAKFYTSE